jgi:hypothetical protein
VSQGSKTQLSDSNQHNRNRDRRTIHVHGVKSVKSASTPTQTTKTLQEILSIAHQGASLYAPENTFAAFDRFLDLVRESKD